MSSRELLYSIAIFILFFCVILYVDGQHSENKKSEYIYNAVSRDNWGGKDTSEFNVTLTETTFTIQEIIPGSQFFEQFVKDSTLHKITFDVIDTNYESNEYWGKLSEANNRLCIFRKPVDYVFIAAHSGMIRITFSPEGKNSRNFEYLIWPTKNK